MSKVEFVDLSGLRIDGRRPNELRKVVIKHGNLQNATGSAIFHHGNTKVSGKCVHVPSCSRPPADCSDCLRAEGVHIEV